MNVALIIERLNVFYNGTFEALTVLISEHLALLVFQRFERLLVDKRTMKDPTTLNDNLCQRQHFRLLQEMTLYTVNQSAESPNSSASFWIRDAQTHELIFLV